MSRGAGSPCRRHPWGHGTNDYIPPRPSNDAPGDTGVREGDTMGVRRKVRDTVEEAGIIIDQGARKVGEIFDDPDLKGAARKTGELIDRGARKTGELLEKGVKKVQETIDKDPDLKQTVDGGVKTVKKVVNKGVELVGKGIDKGEEILTGQKKAPRS